MKNTDPNEVAEARRMPSLAAWRGWLEQHGRREKVVWLIVYHKSSPVASVHWHEAIEHALCYGWVDSKAKQCDQESCYLKFTPRNPKSSWGKRNKERAVRLTEQGYMRPAGQELIDLAKQTGKW